MSSRRTLILVGAIVVGAVAALMILRYVGSVEDKASSDGQMVQVVIATGDIPKGESADAAIAAGRIDLGSRRRIDLPTNAVTRVEDIMDQTATIDLAAGEVITTSKFASGSDLSSSSSTNISPGNVAVTVSVDASRAVAGLVGPGDYVNLMADLSSGEEADGAASAVGSTYVFQKVKVLAIGSNLGAQAAAPAEGTETTAAVASDLVTLDVPPEAAQVITANASRNLRMVLVRPDYQPHPISAYVIDPAKPLPGADGRTPYEGQPATAASTAGAGR